MISKLPVCLKWVLANENDNGQTTEVNIIGYLALQSAIAKTPFLLLPRSLRKLYDFVRKTIFGIEI